MVVLLFKVFLFLCLSNRWGLERCRNVFGSSIHCCICTCVHAWAEAFSNWLIIDFQIDVSFYHVNTHFYFVLFVIICMYFYKLIGALSLDWQLLHAPPLFVRPFSVFFLCCLHVCGSHLLHSWATAYSKHIVSLYDRNAWAWLWLRSVG